MAIDPQHLRQHLAQTAQAYGIDFVLPAGRASERAAPATASVAIPAPSPPAPPRPAATTPEPVTPGGVAAPANPAPPTAKPAPAAAAPPAAPGTDDTREAALRQLRAEVLVCTRCKLHQDRQTAVVGEGNPHTRVLFIGEAPGAAEDRSGRPFVGPAGQLLDRIIAGAMGLQRGDVYIANINKCRPPGNREPEADEVAACLPYLRRQVEILRPEVIVCLGRTAAQNLLGTTLSTTALRGRDLDYCGVPVVVTWHPAYLLRDPSHKRETWEDIKRVNRLLGLPEVPPPAAS